VSETAGGAGKYYRTTLVAEAAMTRRFAAVFVLFGLAVPVSAADDLLRLVPKDSTFVWVVDKPREFVEAVASVPQLAVARNFPQVRAAYETGSAKQFFQLLDYFESELGAKWPELLDKFAGGGFALAFDIRQEPAPTLIVLRGTDAAASEKALGILAKIVEDDGQAKVARSTHHGVEVLAFGKDLHVARVGPVVYAANKPEALDAGLALAESKDVKGSVAGNPTAAAARTAVGPGPLAWVWLDFAAVKQTQKAKDFFDNTRKDLFQTLVFGGTADALRRSDYVAVGLNKTPTGFGLTVSVPAKRAELPKELAIHVPPAGTPGSLPLLEPPGVVYSQSLYLDLAKLWTDRKTIITPEVLTQIEKAEKDISRILPGTTLGALLEQSGPYHRVVFAHTGEKLYRTESGQPIPVPGYVMSVRDPKFGQSLDAVLRGAAFLAGTQVGGMKQADLDFDGVKVNSYTFVEKPLPADPDGVRFNFAPCYATVGDSFVVAGSPGMMKSLITELKKPSTPGHPAVWRNRTYAAGGSAFLSAHPDPAITETVLSQGVGLAEAKKQVAELAAWLGTLGTAGVTMDHGTDAFTVRLEWTFR
jgi:hypothetical protein